MHILVVWQSFLARFREMKSLILRLFLYSVKVLPANEESQRIDACTKTTDVNWTKKHIHRGVDTNFADTSPSSSCEPSDEQRGKTGVGSGVWRDIFPDQPSRAKDLATCATTMRIHRRTHNRAVGEYLEWSAHSSGRIQF